MRKQELSSVVRRLFSFVFLKLILFYFMAPSTQGSMVLEIVDIEELEAVFKLASISNQLVVFTEIKQI